jgi:hypothetical protein
MSVYVDKLLPCIRNRKWPYNFSCHLVADSLEELHSFALGVLGLKKAWFQNHPKHPHYDLTLSMRRKAVLHGVIEVDRFNGDEFLKGHKNVDTKEL